MMDRVAVYKIAKDALGGRDYKDEAPFNMLFFSWGRIQPKILNISSVFRVSVRNTNLLRKLHFGFPMEKSHWTEHFSLARKSVQFLVFYF